MRNRPAKPEASKLPPTRSAWIVLGGASQYEHLLQRINAQSAQATEGAETPDPNTQLVGHWGDSLKVASVSVRRKSKADATVLNRWTAGPNVEPGDRLFFYLLKPRQAIHFVATASSKPFLKEHYLGGDRKDQWRVDFSGLVEVEPISYDTIEGMGERRFLRNRSCHYLRPEFANALLAQTSVKCVSSPSDRDRALAPISGKPELGNPKSIGLAELRALDSALFKYEEDVERNFLEPLGRLAQLARGHVLKRRFDLGKVGVADYLVMRNGRPRFVIEVKHSLKSTKRGWSETDEFRQVNKYARHLNVPFALVDRELVACFHLGDVEPQLILKRTQLVEDDLAAMREVMMGFER